MKKYLFAIVVLLIVPASSLFAHPHAFVDSIITFQFEEKYLEGFWIEWTFDKLFSAEAIMEFDLDRDGVFNKKEEESITKGALTLKEFGYFTYITYSGKTRMVTSVENFKASINDHRLIYRFFIPLRLPKENGKSKLVIAIYDKVFYADFDFTDPKPVRLTGSDFTQCHYELKKSRLKISYNNNDTFGGRADKKYTGVANPRVLVLYF